MKVIQHEHRLFTIEAIGVKRRRVDFGLEPAALVRVGSWFESSESFTHLGERPAVAIEPRRPPPDVLEPVVACGEAGDLGFFEFILDNVTIDLRSHQEIK